MPSDPIPVMFVHGLWMHASGWRPWTELFASRGYIPVTPGWPGDGETAESTRENPDRLNGVGIGDLVRHHRTVAEALPSPPIVVGHSFGGLIAQRLLGDGLVRGAVALAPAQFKGVLRLPLTQVRTVLPILSRPGLRKRTWSHTADSYHDTFANAVTREESDRIFETHTIPGPARPLFEAALANIAVGSPAKIDTRTARGPLLLVAAGRDRTVPEATVHSQYNIQRRNTGVTEYAVLPDRGHSLAADDGWREVAELALDFLDRHGLAATPNG
ncbi:alpha/beta hydrolase [Rhodococcus sp. NPDC003318]|uniref:alpha/beta hydrolase n=1 Tax=Rhodococcus sp. NPDC003318 TaxID=3364503 RepID=UPI0036A55441